MTLSDAATPGRSAAKIVIVYGLKIYLEQSIGFLRTFLPRSDRKWFFGRIATPDPVFCGGFM